LKTTKPATVARILKVVGYILIVAGQLMKGRLRLTLLLNETLK
jgi:hypothetical protein